MMGVVSIVTFLIAGPVRICFSFAVPTGAFVNYILCFQYTDRIQYQVLVSLFGNAVTAMAVAALLVSSYLEEDKLSTYWPVVYLALGGAGASIGYPATSVSTFARPSAAVMEHGCPDDIDTTLWISGNYIRTSARLLKNPPFESHVDVCLLRGVFLRTFRRRVRHRLQRLLGHVHHDTRRRYCQLSRRSCYLPTPVLEAETARL